MLHTAQHLLWRFQSERSLIGAAERKLLTEQAEKSGKPANIIDRMVAGRLHKVKCLQACCSPSALATVHSLPMQPVLPLAVRLQTLHLPSFPCAVLML